MSTFSWNFFLLGIIIININNVNSNIPFTILVPLMLHQTPFKPKAVIPLSNIAIGILSPVSIILTKDGVTVFPNPENAPVVVISIHIKNCEYANILR